MTHMIYEMYNIGFKDFGALQHYSQQPLAAGSIRNTQNTAFQLNETTSLHFYDWFPKPAAVNPADNSTVNSASAQSADNSAANSAVNSAVNSALTNENSAFGDENPDLAHESSSCYTPIASLKDEERHSTNIKNPLKIVQEATLFQKQEFEVGSFQQQSEGLLILHSGLLGVTTWPRPLRGVKIRD
ncbi:hypothetical protein F511_35097 [Dorcoceras hygrometricum]|uniref:Uncharacterized protein n=1 Tax=Dorcoceras hygrometricum TaxID=472368 RepID=A0A2Z7D8X3_9LAMI|nr:hypothetical protein F511_35097 [Dorcoceras hygrometricum]